MSAATALALAAHGGLLEGLGAISVSTFVSHGTVRDYVATDVILRQGDPGTTLHVILTGRVRVDRVAPDGIVTVLAELGPGAGIGEIGALTGSRRTASIVALEPTTTIEVDAPAFAKLATTYPQMHAILSRVLARRMSNTFEVLEQRAAGKAAFAGAVAGGGLG